MKRASYGVVLVGMLLCLTLGAGLARASTLTFSLDKDINAGDLSSPYLTAVFDDHDVVGGPISLELFVSSTLPSEQYVDSWYFNFDPETQVGDLDITRVSGTGPEPIDILKGANSYQAEGDGRFDFGFTFPTGPHDDRFVHGETALFEISGSSGLTLESFKLTSNVQGAQGIYYSGADVGGPHAAGWIGAVDYTYSGGSQDDPPPAPDPPQQVPEPATLLLLGSGLVGVAAGWRRKLRN